MFPNITTTTGAWEPQIRELLGYTLQDAVHAIGGKPCTRLRISVSLEVMAR